jgi:hypothetical protein
MLEDLYIGHGDPNNSNICWCASSQYRTLVDIYICGSIDIDQVELLAYEVENQHVARRYG